MADDLDRRSCLYHYTSATGLDSILSQRLLRATDTSFLNDMQEIIYAAKPLIPQMEALLVTFIQYDADNDPLQKVRSGRLGSTLSAIKRFTRLDADMRAPNPGQYLDGATYVACLSEDHDQLGQWRGYGQSGYSIGFQKDGLKQIPGQLHNVRYGELRQVDYGDDAVNAVCDEIVEHCRTRPPARHPGTHGYFDALNFCMPRLASVKHAAFQQEAEWRLIVSKDSDQGLPARVRTMPRLIPYVELPFEDSWVAEIVIGPGGDSHSVRAVRAALRAHNYDTNKVQITHSEAPFRG
jgi:Protein of unknown function (DUF2971)